MAKSLVRQIFGMPSAEVVSRIEASDRSSAASAAHYRFTARMRSLEAQFEAEASKLRNEYIAELGEIQFEAAE